MYCALGVHFVIMDRNQGAHKEDTNFNCGLVRDIQV